MITSNFEFLKLDIDTAELFGTINLAEENYTYKDYEGALTKSRKLSENLARLVADREFFDLPDRATFNDVLRTIKGNLPREIVDVFYTIKGQGNSAAHELNPREATRENALRILERVYYLLVWYLKTYTNEKIDDSYYYRFLEPQAQERYKTAERKFIYIQTVDNSGGGF